MSIPVARIRIKRFIEPDDEPNGSVPVPPWRDEQVWVKVRSIVEPFEGNDIGARTFYFDTVAEADAFMTGIFVGSACGGEVEMYGGGEYDRGRSRSPNLASRAVERADKEGER